MRGGGFMRLGLLLLLALALRSYAAISEEMLFNDAPIFFEGAQAFLRGDLGSALGQHFHPLTSALIAGVSVVLGTSLETAGLIISVLSGGLATAALYGLARAQFGERVAFAAGLIFAVHPRMVVVAANVQSDGVHLALALLGALVVWRALEGGGIRLGLAAGVLCGLAYLTRPEGLAVGVVLGLWLVADRFARRISWSHFLRVAAGFAAALVLFGGPYVLKLSALEGEWTVSQKKSVIPEVLSVPAFEQVTAAVSEVLVDGLRAAHPSLLLLALFALRPGRPQRRTLYFLSYVALFFVVLVAVHLEAGYISRRHWLVPAALLVPFSACGLLRLCDGLAAWLPRLRAERWAFQALLGVLCVFFVLDSLPRYEPHKVARKQAARWLSVQEPGSVAAWRRRTAYYAGAERFVALEVMPTVDALLGQLRGGGVDFVVVDQEMLPPRPATGFPGLEEVHRVPYPDGAVLVFRVGELPDVAGVP